MPLDANIEADAAANLARASDAKVFIADEKARHRVRHEVDAARAGGISWLDMWAAAEPGAAHRSSPRSRARTTWPR